MYTLQEAGKFIERNKAPYWWVKQGKDNKAKGVDTEDIAESIKSFDEQMSHLPAGPYQIEVSRTFRDRSSSLKAEFQNTNSTQEVAQPTLLSAANLPASQYELLRQQIRNEMLLEQLTPRVEKLEQMVELLQKQVTKLMKDYEDEDGDGIADVLEKVEKVSQVGKAVSEMAKNFAGAKTF